MRKALGLFLALLLAAGFAAWVLFAQVEPAVKSTIMSAGGLATRTQVLVGSVEFSPFTGTGELDGLAVGNPAGFASPNAVVVDRVALKVERSSLVGSGPVVVDSATVIGPRITYEARSLDAASNLETIKKSAQAYAASPAAIQSGKSARRLIVRELTVVGASLTLDLPLPGPALTLPLPPLVLTNIGTDGNGATPSELVRIVCEAIADEARKAVTTAIAGKIRSVLGTLGPSAGMPPKSLPRLRPPPDMPEPPAMPRPSSLPKPPDLGNPPDLPGLPHLPGPPRLPEPGSDLPFPPRPPGF